MVEIKEAQTHREKRLFATFNADMYKDVEVAAPDIISDELTQFNPKNNSAYDFCKVKQFLAYKDGKCVGRIAGIINTRANEKWKTDRVRFTRVDFTDDPEVSEALLSAIENWGRSEGMKEIHGPLGFTDFDQEGMLVDGFDRPGPFFTIYNASYYKSHMEKMGYVKDVDWLEYRLKVPEKPSEKLEKMSELILKRYKFTLEEPKNRRRFNIYLPQVFKLLNQAYSSLYGMVEFTDAQMKSVYNQFAMSVNPEYLKLIYAEDGELVGFGLGVPTLNEALKKHRGRMFPFGWYSVLRAPFKKGAEVLDLYLVGVKPELQKMGLPAVLLNSMAKSARKNGIKYAETGPELETNEGVQSLWKFYESEQHKRRRCWVKPL